MKITDDMDRKLRAAGLRPREETVFNVRWPFAASARPTGAAASSGGVDPARPAAVMPAQPARPAKPAVDNTAASRQTFARQAAALWAAHKAGMTGDAPQDSRLAAFRAGAEALWATQHSRAATASEEAVEEAAEEVIDELVDEVANDEADGGEPPTAAPDRESRAAALWHAYKAGMA